MGLPVLRALSLCTCCRHYPGAADELQTSLKLARLYQPSPKWVSGRPAHRPFRGLPSVHSRCGLHTRTVTYVTVRHRSCVACPICRPRSFARRAVNAIRSPGRRTLLPWFADHRQNARCQSYAWSCRYTDARCAYRLVTAQSARYRLVVLSHLFRTRRSMELVARRNCNTSNARRSPLHLLARTS